jgi:hypothetical protein
LFDVVVEGVNSALIADHTVVRSSPTAIQLESADFIAIGQQEGRNIGRNAILPIGDKVRGARADKTVLGVDADLRTVVQQRNGAHVYFRTRLVIVQRNLEAFATRAEISVGEISAVLQTATVAVLTAPDLGISVI